MTETTEAWAADLMDRQGVAKFLLHYLDSDPSLKVMNLNSPWGSGKTFFIENWMAELKGTRHCIYFNAWEHDYTGDPFISLTAVMHDQLRACLPPGQKAKEQLKTFREKASQAVVAASPVVIKGLVKKLTGVDSELVGDALEDVSLDEAAEKAVEKLIESHGEKQKTIEDFKSVFTNMVDSVVCADSPETQRSSALLVFIDELDRCRPTFAIELLERIKHFFDLNNVKFVIATDTPQLAHAIRAVYGGGFDSSRYLKRFFDCEFTFDNDNLVNWIIHKVDDAKFPNCINLKVMNAQIDSGFWMTNNEPISPDPNAIVDNRLNANQIMIYALALTFDLELRELEKCLRQVVSIGANMGGAEFDLFYCAYLVFLRDAAPELYEKFLIEPTVAVKERFPGKMLYFGSRNVDVHDMANDYRRISTLSPERRRQGLNDESPEPKNTIKWAVESRRTQILSYPQFVALAHRLT